MYCLPPSRVAFKSSRPESYPDLIASPSSSCAGGCTTSARDNSSQRSVSRSSSCALASSNADRSRPSNPPTAPATSGSRRIESRSAPISRGVARPSAARPARRSRSRTPSSASRNRSRPRPSPTSTASASSRALMAAGSTSGARSQRRSSRPPIGVRVRSMTPSSVAPSASPPDRSGSTSSRLRRVISSSGSTSPPRTMVGCAR